MADQKRVELLCVFERDAHRLRVFDRSAVVRERDRAGGFEFAEFGDLFALLSDGDRGDGIDLCKPHLFGARLDVFDDIFVVGHRLGVGHAAHSRKASRDRGAAAALDVLFVLETGLAQVDVHVDERGQRRQPSRVDDRRPLGRFDVADLDDAVSVDGYIYLFAEQVGAFDDDHCFPPRSILSSAILVATPFVTWTSLRQ